MTSSLRLSFPFFERECREFRIDHPPPFEGIFPSFERVHQFESPCSPAQSNPCGGSCSYYHYQPLLVSVRKCLIFLVVVLIVVVGSFAFDLLRIIQEIGLITLSLFWYIYIIMINAAVYDLMFRFFRVLHTLVLSQSPSSSKGKTCQHKLIGKICFIELHLPFEIFLILVLFS